MTMINDFFVPLVSIMNLLSPRKYYLLEILNLILLFAFINHRNKYY